MKSLNVALMVLAAFLLAGCDGKPHHSVYGTDVLKVYNVKEIENTKYGKYEYWITDGTGKDWALRTDSIYEVGDKLEIIVKED